MWRAGLVGSIAVLVVSGPVLAQTGRITGMVTSEGAKPVIGAQVRVAGTAIGALTREDGLYAITIQPGTYTVRVSRLGFAPDSVAGIVVTAGATVTANFQMRAAASLLQGVVVTGYGAQEHRDLTGSVANVTEKDFNTGRVVSPEELIRAKVPV